MKLRNRKLVPVSLKTCEMLLAGILFTIGLAQLCRADTTYTYEGNLFTTFNEFVPPIGTGYSCPPECKITGSFTVFGPLDNVNGAVTPESYSFTDGNTTWSSSNVFPFNTTISTFDVGTNGSGQILHSHISLLQWGIPFLEGAFLQTDNPASGIAGASDS